MKKAFKLPVVILILLSMVVYLAACSGAAKTDKASTKPEATAGSSTDTSTLTPAVSKEPITLSVWSVTMAGNAPSGIQDDPVSKQIEKDLNIKMDMETKSTNEKLAAIMASGDLKDIMIVDKKYAAQLKDMVIDMGPLIEKYGPDIQKNVPKEVLDVDKKLGDGQQKFISGLIMAEAAQPESLWAGVYLRWDYYKELGYPAINNSDDYLKVVADMLKLHPTNEDGKKYYGFSTWYDWGHIINTEVWGLKIKGGEALYGGSAGVAHMDVQTFESSDLFRTEDSGFWDDVSFWNKANRMGLLDPDSFTQKYDQATQKYNTGQALASYISWMIGGSNKYLQTKGIYDKGWFGPLPMPSKNYSFYNKKFGQNSQVFAISKKAKNPERAMELINWLYSVRGAMTVVNGIEGIDWVHENGKYRYTDVYVANSKDPDAGNKFGYNKFSNDLGLNGSSLIPGTKDPISIGLSRELQIANLEKPENALTKEIVQHYGVELPVDILPPNQEYVASAIYDLAGFIPATEPDDIKQIADKVTNYLNQAVPKIILTKDDASFAAYKKKIIKDLIDLGEEKVYAYWEAAAAKGIAEYRATLSK